MPRHPLLKLFGFRALHRDALGLQTRPFYLPAKQILAAARIELLHVQILDIEAQIRHAPSDSLVVPNDNRRHARQRNARHIQTGRLNVDLIPSGRQREFQVWIVRQNRFPAGRVLARNGPGVRSRLELRARPSWKQKVDLSGIATRQHGLFQQLFFPCRGQIPMHLKPTQDAIHDVPRPRIVAQQRKLQRQPAPMRLDEIVDSSRIRGQHGAIGFRQRPRLFFRNSPHS